MTDKTIPAFPVGSGDMRDPTGMTLRDYFAAKALVAAYPTLYGMFMDDILDDWHDDGVKALAQEAYLIADAMMKEREA